MHSPQPVWTSLIRQHIQEKVPSIFIPSRLPLESAMIWEDASRKASCLLAQRRCHKKRCFTVQRSGINFDYERSIFFYSDCQVCKGAPITIVLVDRVCSFQPDKPRINESANPPVTGTPRYTGFYANLFDAPVARVRAKNDLLRVFIAECLSNRLCSGLVCDYHYRQITALTGEARAIWVLPLTC